MVLERGAVLEKGRWVKVAFQRVGTMLDWVLKVDVRRGLSDIAMHNGFGPRGECLSGSHHLQGQQVCGQEESESQAAPRNTAAWRLLTRSQSSELGSHVESLETGS